MNQETNPVPTESKCECRSEGPMDCSCDGTCTCHRKCCDYPACTVFPCKKCKGSHCPVCGPCPIPQPEVSEWEEPSDTMRVDRDEEIDVRQAKTIIRDAVGEFLWSRMYQVMGRVPFHNLIIGIEEALSSQSSAFQKKIGEAVDSVVETVDGVFCQSCLGRMTGLAPVEPCSNCRAFRKAARAAADRIKKENL
jgi:hypothetical protein